MRIENIALEYSAITPEEGEELLYQVYELLLSDPEVIQYDQSPCSRIGV